jgi:4-hydroxybenzoate polyprenyltransferase
LLPILACDSEGALRVSDISFLFFVLMTVTTAAAGYVINDILDEAIDRINKPEKLFVGAHFLHKTAIHIYVILLLLGGAASVILSVLSAFYWFLVCYVAANVVLFAYSKWLKKRPFWGNFTVAIFTACVAWGVAMPLIQPPYTAAQTQVLAVFIPYCGFAFLSNLWREIIKDLEDEEGDRAYNCRTLPIVFGTAFAKNIAFSVAFLLLIALFLFAKSLIINGLYFGLIWLLATVAFPLLASIWLLYCAEAKTDYGFISTIAKMMMLGGLLFLFLV